MKGEKIDNEEFFYRQLNKMDTSTADAAHSDADSGGSIGAVAGPVTTSGSNLDFLERTAMDAQLSSDKIRAILGKNTSTAQYPASQLANNLRMVSQLIAAGMPTRVYYVSLGGFDTCACRSPIAATTAAVTACRKTSPASSNSSRVRRC